MPSHFGCRQNATIAFRVPFGHVRKINNAHSAGTLSPRRKFAQKTGTATQIRTEHGHHDITSQRKLPPRHTFAQNSVTTTKTSPRKLPPRIKFEQEIATTTYICTRQLAPRRKFEQKIVTATQSSLQSHQRRQTTPNDVKRGHFSNPLAAPPPTWGTTPAKHRATNQNNNCTCH